MTNRQGRALVGLDIQDGQLAAVEVRHGRTEPQRAAVASLPPGLVHEGEIRDVEGLASQIKSFFHQNKLSRKVRLGVANQQVVVRALEFPALESRDELDAAVRFQARDELPMSLDEAVLDYQVVERFADAANSPRMRVVLVAARREMIERNMAAARRAGLKLVGIDLSAFALIRALYPSANGSNGSSGERPSDAVVYCHLGAVTNLAVAQGTACLFARAIPQGFESMATELAGRRGLAIHHARQWLAYVGLECPLEGLEGDADLVADVREAVEQGVARLADEVRLSLDYYSAQPDARPVQRTLLSGPGTAIDGLVARLGERLAGPVETATASIAAQDGASPADLALAFGLALEEALSP